MDLAEFNRDNKGDDDLTPKGRVSEPRPSVKSRENPSSTWGSRRLTQADRRLTGARDGWDYEAIEFLAGGSGTGSLSPRASSVA